MSQPGAISQDPNGNVTISGNAIQGVMGHVASMGTGANDAANGMGNLLKAVNQNPQFQQKLNEPKNVAPGAALVQGGKAIFQNPSAAAGKEAYDQTVTDIPEEAPTPGTPAVPPGMLAKLFGGTGTPAVPGTPGHPKQTITRRVPISFAGAVQPPAAAAPTAAPPAMQAAPPVPPADDVPAFADEATARAAGHGSGAVIRIQGVGKVRLR